MSKIIVNLDKPREVKLTLNAMLQFHEDTGIDLESSSDLKKMGLKEMRHLLWLSVRDPEDTTIIGKIKRAVGLEKPLTLERVGDLVHTGNLEEINQALTMAKDDATTEDTKKK